MCDILLSISCHRVNSSWSNKNTCAFVTWTLNWAFFRWFVMFLHKAHTYTRPGPMYLSSTPKYVHIIYWEVAATVALHCFTLSFSVVVFFIEYFTFCYLLVENNAIAVRVITMVTLRLWWVLPFVLLHWLKECIMMAICIPSFLCRVKSIKKIRIW